MGQRLGESSQPVGEGAGSVVLRPIGRRARGVRGPAQSGENQPRRIGFQGCGRNLPPNQIAQIEYQQNPRKCKGGGLVFAAQGHVGERNAGDQPAVHPVDFRGPEGGVPTGSGPVHHLLDGGIERRQLGGKDPKPHPSRDPRQRGHGQKDEGPLAGPAGAPPQEAGHVRLRDGLEAGIVETREGRPFGWEGWFDSN